MCSIFLHENNKQQELLHCEIEKDLGVWIGKDLKWSKQCSNSAQNQYMALAVDYNDGKSNLSCLMRAYLHCICVFVFVFACY